MHTTTMTRPHWRFDVWHNVNGDRVFLGVVTADNQLAADKKATTLYGAKTWTTPKE